MNTTDKMITRTEAAARLGVSMRTLDRYIRQGRIESTKYLRTHSQAGPVRVSEASLNDYLSASKMTAQGDGGDDGGPGEPTAQSNA